MRSFEEEINHFRSADSIVSNRVSVGRSSDYEWRHGEKRGTTGKERKYGLVCIRVELEIEKTSQSSLQSSVSFMQSNVQIGSFLALFPLFI